MLKEYTVFISGRGSRAAGQPAGQRAAGRSRDSKAAGSRAQQPHLKPSTDANHWSVALKMVGFLVRQS